MAVFVEVTLAVASPVVAFVLGLMWRRVRTVVVYRRARQFWRPLLRRRLSIVVGRHRQLGDFERSGLVAVGDIGAVTGLTGFLDRVGFAGYRVLWNDQYIWAQAGPETPLRDDLVVLGSPDANLGARQLMDRVDLGV